MVNVLSGVRDRCRQYIQDEVGNTHGAEVWDNDEIIIHIRDCLVELSVASPREVKESLTADGTLDFDVSDVNDLISVIKLEYPVDEEPKEFFNCTQFGDTVTMDAQTAPTSGDTVYAYCRKYHTLTETTSTLNEREERALVLGACGQLAMSKAMAFVNKVTVGRADTYSALYKWGLNNYQLFQRDLRQLHRPKVSMRYAP